MAASGAAVHLSGLRFSPDHARSAQPQREIVVVAEHGMRRGTRAPCSRSA